MRERTPPYGPLLELPIYVGDTQETRKLKGPRGCPRDSEQRSFWTDQFKLGKRVEPALPADIRDSAPVASDLAVIIDDWTFQGDDAQKTIETACAGFGGCRRNTRFRHVTWDSAHAMGVGSMRPLPCQRSPGERCELRRVGECPMTSADGGPV